MHTSPRRSHEPSRDGTLLVAAGCLALMVLGASVERRSTLVDRSVVGARSVEPAVAPPTNQDLLREMLTHD